MSLNFKRWSTLSRPSPASLADHYRSLESFKATEATTTTNIDVRCMQQALRQKSLGAVSLTAAGWVKHAGSWSEPFHGFTTFAGYASASNGSLSSMRPS
jgi:hypothetical protein